MTGNKPIWLIFGLTLSLNSYCLDAADWPYYRGPNFDGSTAETISANWGKGLPQAWKIQTPNGFSSFAVGGGLAVTQVSRGGTGTVLAVDAKTGEEKWAVSLGRADYGNGGGNSGAPDNKGGDGPRSTPAIDGDNVYVLSSDLELLCINAATGKITWKKDIVKDLGGRNIRWENAASPLIDGDLIFLAGGAPGKALMAINKKDGSVAWAGEDDLMTHSTPVVAEILGTRQVIFFTQKGLVSCEPKAGKVLWRYAFPYKVSTAMTPIVGGDIVYCSAGYGVGSGAVKITKDGNKFKATEIWRQAGKAAKVLNHWSTPVYKDGHLYGMFSFKRYANGPMLCVEVATGKVKWSQPGFGAGNVIRTGGNVLALTDYGELVLVAADPAGYRELARTKAVAGKCWSTPSVSNGMIYARSTKEGVCLNAQ
jgi:outer membrane protein assembly factor BamB